jgi:acetyltransferase-like isoleucine patch superfamily enzyme
MRLTDRKYEGGSAFSEGLNAKWKVIDLAKSLICTPYYMLCFLFKGIKWGKNWRLFGLPVIHKYKGSDIRIGSNFTMRNWYTSNPLGVNRSFLTTLSKDSKLIIGDNVGISGSVICVAEEINIGNNTLVGANTRIFDNDFHSINHEERGIDAENIKSKKIIIGENVLIGANCLIIKGVNIGNNSIIGAGSVVTGAIEDNSVYSGNPAKFIKKIN